MFKNRATEAELMDDLSLEGAALRQNLDELEIINTWLGGNKVVTNALTGLLPLLSQKNKPVSVADLGCGGGDLLRVCAKWAAKNQVPMQLTGIDANAFMVEYATGKCRDFPNIKFQQENIFSATFSHQSFDILICSLFCHHFSDQELILLLKKMYAQAKTGIIINDLHRNPIAYYSIKAITKLFSKSYLVKNDAPLSVLRAFKSQELEAILKAAGIQNYKLRWKWAFRWQLIIYK